MENKIKRSPIKRNKQCYSRFRHERTKFNDPQGNEHETGWGYYCSRNGHYCSIFTHTKFVGTRVEFLYAGYAYAREYNYVLNDRALMLACSFLIRDVLKDQA